MGGGPALQACPGAYPRQPSWSTHGPVPAAWLCAPWPHVLQTTNYAPSSCALTNGVARPIPPPSRPNASPNAFRCPTSSP